jgi:hypothetical protein
MVLIHDGITLPNCFVPLNFRRKLQINRLAAKRQSKTDPELVAMTPI